MKLQKPLLPLLLLAIMISGFTWWAGREENVTVQPGPAGLLSLSLPVSLFPEDAQPSTIDLKDSQSELIIERARQQIEWDTAEARAVYQVNHLQDAASASNVYLQVAGRVYSQPPPTRLVTEYADAGIYTCANEEAVLWCNYVGLYDDHVVTLAVMMEGKMNLDTFLEIVYFVDRQMGFYTDNTGRQL